MGAKPSEKVGCADEWAGGNSKQSGLDVAFGLRERTLLRGCRDRTGIHVMGGIAHTKSTVERIRVQPGGSAADGNTRQQLAA